MTEESKSDAPAMGATAGVGGASPGGSTSPVCIYLINGLYSYAANRTSNYSELKREAAKIADEYVIKVISNLIDEYIDEYEKYQFLNLLARSYYEDGFVNRARQLIEEGRDRLNRAEKILSSAIYTELPAIWHETTDSCIKIVLADGRAYIYYFYEKKIKKEQWQVVEIK